MISTYTIDIACDASMLRFRAVFGCGKFLRLEYADGDLSTLDQWKDVLNLIPLYESELIELDENPAVHVHFEARQGIMSTYRQLLTDYSNWYKNRFGFAPVLDIMSGRLMKQIIRSIEVNCSKRIDVRTIWHFILTHLDQFSSPSIEHPGLATIAININDIIVQLNAEVSTLEYTNY